MSERVRIDKWLWAARFFKTRSLAVQAIESGKIRVNGERVKPAKDVKAGDQVLVRIGALEWTVTVLAVSEWRGPAEQARMLYAEAEESRARRTAAIAERKAAVQPLRDARGRPTKRDRRMIHRLTEK